MLTLGGRFFSTAPRCRGGALDLVVGQGHPGADGGAGGHGQSGRTHAYRHSSSVHRSPSGGGRRRCVRRSRGGAARGRGRRCARGWRGARAGRGEDPSGRERPRAGRQPAAHRADGARGPGRAASPGARRARRGRRPPPTCAARAAGPAAMRRLVVGHEPERPRRGAHGHVHRRLGGDHDRERHGQPAGAPAEAPADQREHGEQAQPDHRGRGGHVQVADGAAVGHDGRRERSGADRQPPDGQGVCRRDDHAGDIMP